MLKVLVRVEIQYIYSKIIYKCIFSNTCSGLMMGLKVNVGFFFILSNLMWKTHDNC